jgi:hypothetical protein
MIINTMKLSPSQLRDLIKQEYLTLGNKKLVETPMINYDELMAAMMSYLDSALTGGMTLEEACNDLVNKAHEACDKWAADMSANPEFPMAAE